MTGHQTDSPPGKGLQDLSDGGRDALIFLSPPHSGEEERSWLSEALDSRYLAPTGPQVRLFEERMALRCGPDFEAIALSSGTAAIHLAYLLSDLGPGDCVIASDFTFVASVNPARMMGADISLVDSEADSWNMDPNLLEDAIKAAARVGKRIRAITVVHIYGQCADMDPILRLAREHGIPVIEDAAEAVGASYKGKPAGAMGDLGCYSFNGNKIITTTGGGMLVSRNSESVDRARYLSNQARDPVVHYEHQELGFNYGLSNLLAGFGIGQLEKLDQKVRRRREIFDTYRDQLQDLAGITFMPEPPWSQATRWLSCLTIDPASAGTTAEKVRLALLRENIEARPLWKPMHLQPVYRDAKTFGGSVSEHFFATGLCLPSGDNLSPDDQQKVIDCIRKAFRR